MVIGGINNEFVDGQEVKLQAISYRYEDERAVWSALRSGEMVAVATVDAIGGAFGFVESGLDPWSVPDTVTDEATTLPRIVIEIGLGEQPGRSK